MLTFTYSIPKSSIFLQTKFYEFLNCWFFEILLYFNTFLQFYSFECYKPKKKFTKNLKN